MIAEEVMEAFIGNEEGIEYSPSFSNSENDMKEANSLMNRGIVRDMNEDVHSAFATNTFIHSRGLIQQREKYKDRMEHSLQAS